MKLFCLVFLFEELFFYCLKVGVKNKYSKRNEEKCCNKVENVNAAALREKKGGKEHSEYGSCEAEYGNA